MKARKKRCTKARPRCKLYIDDNSLQVFDFNGDYSDDYDNENEKFMMKSVRNRNGYQQATT